MQDLQEALAWLDRRDRQDQQDRAAGKEVPVYLARQVLPDLLAERDRVEQQALKAIQALKEFREPQE